MRLFVALRFSPKVEDHLYHAARLLREQSASGSFSRKENLHLTLAFIGETQRCDEARQAVAAVRAEAFPLLLRGFGRFPGKDGDLWWMGMEKSPPLEKLHSQVAQRLRAGGFSLEERPLRPHITLGRRVLMKPEFELASFEAGIAPVPTVADKLSLMRSQRIQGKLTYTPILEHPLRGSNI